MAVTFSNPRLSALPCERMRGCSFADDFLTATSVADNYGQENGSGHTYDKGLTVDGNGHIYYDTLTQAGAFSVVLQFSASALIDKGILIANSDLVVLDPGNSGFCIWATLTGISATYSDGATRETPVSVTIDYSDGETHTVTFIVAKSGRQYLNVDAETQVSSVTTVTGSTGGVGDIRVGGYRTGGVHVYGFVGTVYRARLFDAQLTEAEHTDYYDGTLYTFMDQPWAAYPCNSFCDDSDGNYVWDRTKNKRDITKGDGSTPGTWPGFVASTSYDDPHYSFDFVNDRFQVPALPATYTTSAAMSWPQLPYPWIQQDNDTTLVTDLEAIQTAGTDGFWGYLRSLIIYDFELSQLQLNHDEYQHLYWLWRGRAYGAYHRLITEGTCKLAMFMDSAEGGVYTDLSRSSCHAYGHDITRDGYNGCSPTSADSHVHVFDEADLRLGELTIAVYGSLDPYVSAGTILDKGANYKLQQTSATTFDLNGQTLSHTETGYTQVVVVAKDGKKAKLYIDGEYIADSSGTVTLDDTDTTELAIFNNNEHNNRYNFPIKHVAIFNSSLTEYEIRSLYEQAQSIGETTMETGNRERIREVFTAAAVDEDIDPGGPFQLLSIEINFNLAPTTAENVTITSINGDSDVVALYTFDPSSPSGTSFRYIPSEPRQPDDTTIAIDYTNTDGRTITVNTTYQLDQSVV